MAHTYASLLFHCVFSTKDRVGFISEDIRERLWPYMGGIARENDMVALTIGGTQDHAHLLLSLKTTMCVAKAIQVIKAGSSKWVSETFPLVRDFAWQEGYGAFSVSVSHVEDTLAYIGRQVEHHRQKTFQEEYIEFLKKHHIEYDERCIWE